MCSNRSCAATGMFVCTERSNSNKNCAKQVAADPNLQSDVLISGSTVVWICTTGYTSIPAGFVPSKSPLELNQYHYHVAPCKSQGGNKCWSADRQTKRAWCEEA